MSVAFSAPSPRRIGSSTPAVSWTVFAPESASSLSPTLPRQVSSARTANVAVYVSPSNASRFAPNVASRFSSHHSEPFTSLTATSGKSVPRSPISASPSSMRIDPPKRSFDSQPNILSPSAASSAHSLSSGSENEIPESSSRTLRPIAASHSSSLLGSSGKLSGTSEASASSSFITRSPSPASASPSFSTSAISQSGMPSESTRLRKKSRIDDRSIIPISSWRRRPTNAMPSPTFCSSHFRAFISRPLPFFHCASTSSPEPDTESSPPTHEMPSGSSALICTESGPSVNARFGSSIAVKSPSSESPSQRALFAVTRAMSRSPVRSARSAPSSESAPSPPSATVNDASSPGCTAMCSAFRPNFSGLCTASVPSPCFSPLSVALPV